MLQIRIEDPASARTFATDRTELLVGRRQDVDLVVTDAAASRTHCMLRVEGAKLTVTDLGTVNGTKVDGERIEQAVLQPGQAFRIGKTTFRIAACGGVSVALPPPLRLEGPGKPAPAFRAPVPTGGPPPDFGRELRRLLSRTPWYTVSLVAHVFALLLMALIPFEVVTNEHQPKIAAIEPRAEEELESLDDALDTEEVLHGLPDVEEEIVAPDDEPKAKTDQIQEVDQEYVPPTISPSPGTRIRILDNPLPVKRKRVLEIDDKPVNTNNLDEEHDSAAKAVLKGLGTRSLPTGIKKRRIMVVKGDFDEMEKVLELYKIPHTIVTPKYLQRRGVPSDVRILCINCAHEPSSIAKKKLVPHVKAFVLRGGWLITSDWALTPYVVDAFPHRVKRVRVKKTQRDTTVEVDPVRTSPLLQGAFDRRRRTIWWLEETSRFFRVVPGKANVLVRSPEMKRRFGPDEVVIEFKEGRGRVVHLLGHFYQKDGNRLGVVGMHRVVLNFIVERFPTGRG